MGKGKNGQVQYRSIAGRWIAMGWGGTIDCCAMDADVREMCDSIPLKGQLKARRTSSLDVGARGVDEKQRTVGERGGRRRCDWVAGMASAAPPHPPSTIKPSRETPQDRGSWQFAGPGGRASKASVFGGFDNTTQLNFSTAYSSVLGLVLEGFLAAILDTRGSVITCYHLM